MNSALHLALRGRSVVVTLFLTLCLSFGVYAEEVPGMDIFTAKPTITEVQKAAAQKADMELRSAENQAANRNILTAAALMFLFGSFCAIWAQNTSRNSVLWFLAGFVFTVVPVLVILWLNPRHKKRGRRMFIYGGSSR